MVVLVVQNMDHVQHLDWCLDNPNKLCAGYENGIVLMWEVNSKSLVEQVELAKNLDLFNFWKTESVIFRQLIVH